jgi:hypothetical protein
MSVVEEVRELSPGDKIRNQIKEKWLKQLMGENPESNPYMMEVMIDLYLLDPKKCEEIIMAHK